MAAVAAPATRFTTARDGVSIAYASHGNGPPLVFVRGWVSHLEMLWERPAFRAYFNALAQRFRVTRFDMRGNGLSDREAPGFTLDDLVLDLEAVMAAVAGGEPAVVYGASYGGPIALAYAARNPARLSHLILDGTFVSGPDITTRGRQETILAMFRNMPEVAAAAMRIATHPDQTSDVFERSQNNWQAITPQVAATLYALGFKLDLSDLLPEVRVPALVLHRRGSRSFPFELGRRLAAGLPDARFVALDGRAQEPWDGDPEPGMAAIADFLGVPLEIEAEDQSQADAAPVAVLFTDLVGSTPMTQALGDAGAQEVVRAHNRIVREALRHRGGSEIKQTGDGIMASFHSVARALACAAEIQDAIARRNSDRLDTPFAVSIGINAGEPVNEESDLYGSAVQLAARLCQQAGPGQVFVSRVVRDLAAGKGFQFEPLGEASLKGFPAPVEVFELLWGGG